MTLSDLTLLLVEDTPSDARLIEEYLIGGQWGEETDAVPDVVRADSLAAGIDARSDETDLVLLDLNLPDSTGLDTLRSMLDTVERTPIVVLTGMDDRQLGVQAVERGAQDYLRKDELSPGLLRRTTQYAIERAGQELELRRRNRELAVLNQIVRHDIRNEVSLLVGWGSTLEEYVEPGGEEYLSQVLDAADHIVQLTETVGDFVKIHGDDRDPELRSYDLIRALRTEIETIRSIHPEADLTVERDLSDEPGIEVEANEMLSSVFRNLLKSAVTRTDTESPGITVDVDRDDTTVRVTVANDGPGIPDDRKEEIFGRGQTGLEDPGSEIGLYLVDTLVDTFGGAVRIEDNEPEGTVFRVELPRAGD